jgi:hypothetical protein
METTMTNSLPKEFPARSSPRPEDLLAAFRDLAARHGAEFAGVALWCYLTDKLDRTPKLE